MKKSIEILFGQVLRKLRNNAKFTQEILAEKSGLDRTFISMLERGERQPSLTTLFKLAAALNLQTSALLKEIEDKLNP